MLKRKSEDEELYRISTNHINAMGTLYKRVGFY